MKATYFALSDESKRLQDHITGNLSMWKKQRSLRRFLLSYISEHEGSHGLVAFDNLNLDQLDSLQDDGSYDGLSIYDAYERYKEEIGLQLQEYIATLVADFLKRTPGAMAIFDNRLTVRNLESREWYTAAEFRIGEEIYHYISRESAAEEVIASTLLDGRDHWFVGACAIINESRVPEVLTIEGLIESIQVVSLVFTVALDGSGYAIWTQSDFEHP